jgi:2-polyprenyl-3-methyl-5-hydroxy-6-metoxy-1,4-benzoquinol methylase
LSRECEDGVVQRGSISYARIADRYERVRGGAERAGQLADALTAWLPDGRVGDVGAGTGIVTERLARPGIELVACDLSVEMLVQAAERLPGRVHVADAGALALRDAAMDALTYVWVLHHVADLRTCLEEAWRVLRPGGRALSISGLSLPVGDDMAPIFEALSDTLRPRRREQAMAVSSVGGHVGFELVHDGLVTMAAEVSPDGLADSMMERLFSHLWDLSDEQWRTHVEPAIAELRALPDPDQPRRRVFHHPLVVLEKR